MNEKETISKLHGIQGREVLEVEENGKTGDLILKIERENGQVHKCSVCEDEYLICYDHHPARKVEDLPAWGRRSFVEFHVFKYLSDAIDDVRREEQGKAEKEGKTLLKGCRWIMLKKDLTRKQNSRKCSSETRIFQKRCC